VTEHVEGSVRLEPAPATLGGATVHVRVVDASFADAPSQLIVERNLDLDGPVIPYKLDFSREDPSDQYELQVHVDVNGDGEIAPGDYITMQSYPVIPGERHVDVTASRVG
jgi:putative lipoprotein